MADHRTLRTLLAGPAGYSVIGLIGVGAYLMLPADGQEVAYVLFPIAAALLAWRRYRLETHQARIWVIIALFFGSFAIADTAYFLDPRFPGPADVIYLLGYGLGIWGAIGLRDGGSKGQRAYAIRILDAGIVAACLTSVLWLIWIGPSSHLAGGFSLEKAVGLAYPFLDLLILAVVISGGRVLGSRAWFVAGLVCFIAADMWYSIGAPSFQYATGVWADIGWLSGYVLWGAAALGKPIQHDPPAVVPKPPTRVFLTVTVFGTLASFLFYEMTTENAHVAAAAITAVVVSILVGMRLEVTHRYMSEMLAATEVQNAALEQAMYRTDAIRRRNHMILDTAAEGIVGVDQDGVGTFVNRSATTMLGYDDAELVGTPIHQLVHHSFDDGRPRSYDQCLVYKAIVTGQQQQSNRDVYWRKDGTSFLVEYVANPILEGQEVIGAVVTFRDVSALQSLEEQVRSSQRLEAMGRLAGGIAHDFNNLLAVIGNYAEFLEEDLPADLPQRADISVIQEAVGKGAALVRQLLAFSKRDIARPTVVHIDDVLRGMERLLRPTLGEDIRVEIDCAADLWDVFMDPGHFEQVVMNLAVNASDAMPEGGSISFAAINDVSDGREMVMLTVSDTGMGMPPEVMGQVFEPFFTTKTNGHGLGLATSFGIVSQAGGGIVVRSQPDIGTTFEICLPRSLAPSGNATAPQEPTAIVGGTERVLLVEDEGAVRASVSRSLVLAGYEVVECASGREAIERVDKGFVPEIIISDVVMPQMSGPVLIERLSQMGLHVPVLFMSGYSEEALLRRDVFEHPVALLAKPFKRAALLSAVRTELARPSVVKA